MATGGSSRVALNKVAGSATDIDRDELRDLYRIAVDEYRFEVSLNSQRTQYYLALNAATLAAATGLLKIGGQELRPVVAVLFVLGGAVAFLAHRMIRKGHEYYRRAVYKKTLIEQLLGRLQRIDGYSYPGANLAISTTAGMLEADNILENPDSWIRRPSGAHTVTTAMLRVMRGFLVVDIAAVSLLLLAAILDMLK